VGASIGGGTSLVAVGDGHVDASALVLVDVAPRLERDGVTRINTFMTGIPTGSARSKGSRRHRGISAATRAPENHWTGSGRTSASVGRPLSLALGPQVQALPAIRPRAAEAAARGVRAQSHVADTARSRRHVGCPDRRGRTRVSSPLSALRIRKRCKAAHMVAGTATTFSQARASLLVASRASKRLTPAAGARVRRDRSVAGDEK
jgi:hypothetical protein